MILGFDVSHWKGQVSPQVFIDEGGRFLICKATDGLTFVDETYEWYRTECQAVDLPFGSFHYFRVASDPEDQAEHYHDTTGWHALPPKVDVERANNTGIVSKAEFSIRLKAHLDAVEALYQRRPEIYTSYYSWIELTDSPSWSAGYPLWVANYGVDEPKIPPHFQDYVMWQFSESYVIDGHEYDANYFNGAEDAFMAYIGEEPPLPLYVKVTGDLVTLKAKASGSSVTTGSTWRGRQIPVIGRKIVGDVTWYETAVWVRGDKVEEVT